MTNHQKAYLSVAVAVVAAGVLFDTAGSVASGDTSSMLMLFLAVIFFGAASSVAVYCWQRREDQSLTQKQQDILRNAMRENNLIEGSRDGKE